jgi:hypothetical protein
MRKRARCIGHAGAVDKEGPMTRTAISLQGLFLDANGSPAAGTVVATPNSTLTNGGIEYPPAPIAGVLDPSGRIVAQSTYALEIGATDDAGTEPTGSSYTFTLKLDGASIQEFSAVVPAASTANETNGATVLNSAVVTLSSLVAAASMVGQAITGTNIPADTTVLSIGAAGTNQLTLSAEATATTATGCAFTVGGAVEFSALAADAL